jgi:putative flippase GtrA
MLLRRDFELLRIGRFALVGMVATLVHSAAYLALVSFAPIAATLANLVAFAAAFLASLFGHFRFTFRSPARVTKLMRFVVTAFLGVALNAAFVLMVEQAGYSPQFAVVLFVGVTPPITYLVMRNWVYR